MNKLHRAMETGRTGVRQGMILFPVILLLSIITLVAASLVGITVAELKSTNYSVSALKAFYDAEAGVRYVVDCINNDLKAGTFSLYNETGSVIQVAYTAPGGYQFDTVTALQSLGHENMYLFTVTGHYANARSVIEVTVRRPRLFGGVGIFGGDSVDIQTWMGIYSYHSGVTTNPSAATSTGEANVGSNGGIVVQNHTVVDGMFFMGADENGLSHVGPAGYSWTNVAHIEADPLGARDGSLAEAFVYYSNNNDNAASGISNNVISVNPNAAMTLSSGRYYLEDFYMGPNSTLTIAATPDDPVVIYLHGSFRIQPNMDIVVTNGTPSSFYIFSDAEEEIDIQPHSMLRAFVYAPYADLQVKPNSELAGFFWGKTVRLQPQSEIFLDVSLQDHFLAAEVEIIQWRRL